MNKTTTWPSQEVVANPAPITQLQVRPSFRICIALKMAEEMRGEAVTGTDKGRSFFMSYHLKGVCKSNWGGQYSHRRLLSIVNSFLPAWKSQLCGSSPPPFMELDAVSFGRSTLAPRAINTEEAEADAEGA